MGLGKSRFTSSLWITAAGGELGFLFCLDGSQTRLLADARRQRHTNVPGRVGQRRLENFRPAKVLHLSLPLHPETQNHRSLNPERCLLFKSSKAIRQKPNLLQTWTSESSEMMQTVNVDMKFVVTGAQDLDRLTSQVFEELLNVENSDPAISNSGLQSELESGKVWIQLAASSSDFSHATVTASEAILRAIRSSSQEPVRFELIEQNAAVAA